MQNNIINEILIDLNNSMSLLLKTILLFSQEQFNEIPFKDSWTAGQVAEHIYKSESGMLHLLKGNNKTTTRNPDQHVQQIRTVFLDFSTKMKSPEFILPSEEKMQRDELYENLNNNRNKIIELAGSLDLSKTFYDFPIPVLGELTGIELMTFIICHSTRHTHQLNKIFDSFS